MSARHKEAALQEIGQLARTAPRRFAPLRMKAEAGEIDAATFHAKLADTTEALLWKIETVHRRKIATRIWAKDAREIDAAFKVARGLVNRASLDA